MISAEKKTGLFFTRSIKEGYSYLDIGRDLSVALQNENTDGVAFPMKAYDTLCQILSDGIMTDAEGRKYVAITNYAILFEPALRINVRTIIEKYAKQMLFILKIDHELTDYSTYYPFPEDHTYMVDLTNINYVTLK